MELRKKKSPQKIKGERYLHIKIKNNSQHHSPYFLTFHIKKITFLLFFFIKRLLNYKIKEKNHSFWVYKDEIHDLVRLPTHRKNMHFHVSIVQPTKLVACYIPGGTFEDIYIYISALPIN